MSTEDRDEVARELDDAAAERSGDAAVERDEDGSPDPASREADTPDAERPKDDAPQGEVSDGEAPDAELPDVGVAQGEEPRGETSRDEMPPQAAPDAERPTPSSRRRTARRKGESKATEPEQRRSAGAGPSAGPRPHRPHAGSRTLVRAQARYVRTSARKARMVCVHLRGKSVAEARAILAFTPRAVARDWSKLLESAVANAENNHELLEEDLVVREAYADEGPTIKRFQPRARGRATPILKRTSHLTITLSPRR